MKFVTNKKSFALIFTLLLLSLIILICTVYSLIAANGLAMSNRITDSIRAFYVADAGLADALIRLRAPGEAPDSFNVGSASNPVTIPVGPGNRAGSYYASVVSDRASVLPKYTITSMGTYNGVRKKLELVVQTEPITSFVYISNSEIDQYGWQEYWGPDTLITGPYHTNGQLNIFGSPTFDGPTSQHWPAVNYFPYTENNPHFTQGLTLNAPIISFPRLLDDLTSSIQAAAGQDASWNPYYLTGATSITLDRDALYITNANSTNGNIINHLPLPLPPNNAIFVKNGTVTVHGSLKGRLVIGCSSDILINDSITYDTNPITHPGSTDMLGLVADGNVVLTNPPLTKINHPEIPDSDINIEIDASIVALNGCFELQDFDQFLRGDLIMFGGLACKWYGPNGVFDYSGNLTAGYRQDQIYDTRLKDTPPPCYGPVKDENNRIAYRKISFAEIFPIE